MNITLNGRPGTRAEARTLEGLIDALGITGVRVAVMLNDEIVKKELFSVTPLNEGDRVEVIQMVGGG